MPTKKAKASKALMAKTTKIEPKQQLMAKTTKISSGKNMPGSAKLKANAPVSSLKMEMVHTSQKVGKVKKDGSVKMFKSPGKVKTVKYK